MRGHTYPGLWINFESGEGGGKGTQLRLLNEYLTNRGFMVETGREPGTTLAGEQIRKFLQDPNFPNLNPRTEMLLYVGIGVEFFENIVKHSLIQGDIFITDRWRYSTKAYQGYGLGLSLDVIDTLINFSCDSAKPDLTLLIDVDPRIGLERAIHKKEFGEKKDKIEARELEYHQKVREGYLRIAEQNPESFRVIPYIDGNVSEMQMYIRNYVNSFINENHLESKLSRFKPEPK